MQQASRIIYKTEMQSNEFRATSSTSLVSSTSSPTTMRPISSSLKIKSEMKIERGHEEPSSSIPDLEFDGTTVLCRVCGDKASGFHYGVHSCEGCKGFFRRSIQQKIQYRPCTKNQQCSILRINRNRCQYCRLKKCISVGMSRDAVRFGRVPKREKARILAAMQQSSNSRSLVKTVSTELDDEHRLRVIVVQAHFETCDFTRDKVEPMLIRAREHPSYTACPPTLACPLNPNPQPLTGQEEMLQDFSKRFSPAIRGVVEFAKRIPGFSLLSQEDQVTLLKAGVFEVLLVRLACMFDAQTSTMICLNGQVLKRESIHSSSNARFLMDSMFDFAERLNVLGLTDGEIGMFCSIVIIAPDRPGLRDVEFVKKMRNQLTSALKLEFNDRHPGQSHILEELMKKIPDLRTLNALHSDKLLAFKMTEQQQQLKQQQPQYWNLDEENKSASPVGSSWSSSSDEAKSPLGSVSSTESVGSAEVTSVNEFHPHSQQFNHISSNVTNSPLLAASLTGEFCPQRHRANSSSPTSGEDELVAASHLISNGITITPVTRPQQPLQSIIFRKSESPNNDSGIESGPEKLEKAGSPASTSSSTSSDSSQEKRSSVPNMPVLRGCLEAPPLFKHTPTNVLKYKPHKKFRHSHNYKESAEAEPVNTSQHFSSTCIQSSLSSTHSTLTKSLNQTPLMTEEEIQQTNRIHNFIMHSDSIPSSQLLQDQPSVSSHLMEEDTTITSLPIIQETKLPSPHVTAVPTACPYKQNSWSSVITTAHRYHPYNPIKQEADFNHRVYYQIQQTPHSTSPATSQRCSPVSTTPKLRELHGSLADSQQPLNLSKKSPSPPPLSMPTSIAVGLEA